MDNEFSRKDREGVTKTLYSFIRDLDDIEARILDNDLPYGDPMSTNLYTSVNLLKNCANHLKSQLASSYANAEFTDVTRQILKFIELVKKLNKISSTRSSDGIFEAVQKEVVLFHSSIVGSSSGQKIEVSTKEKGRFKEYVNRSEEILSEITAKSLELDEKTKKIEAAASLLTKTAEKKTSKEWTDEYLEYIKYETYFENKNFAREYKNIFTKIVTRLALKFRRSYSLLFRETLFYRGLSYNNLTKKWQFLRAFWLLCLLVSSVVYLVHFWDFNFEDKSTLSYVLEKTIFLPLLFVVSLAFTFAGRNYKVNAHLFEQYKHRYIVAKTMNNLMTLDNLKNERIKIDLIQLGSKVLFEFKPSGYMNKSDKDDLNYKELMEIYVKERQ